MPDEHPRGFGRGGALLCGWLALTGSGILLVLRLVDPASSGLLGGPVVGLAAGLVAAVPWGVPMALVAVVCFAWRRRGRTGGAGLVAASLVLVVLGTWQAPYFTGTEPGGEVDVVVMALNTSHGHADPAGIARLVRRHDVDVLVLSELTPRLAFALGNRPEMAQYGFRYGDPQPGVAGTVTLSRHRLGPGEFVPIVTGAHRVAVAGPRRFTLVGVHAAQPLYDAPRWRQDLRVLGSTSRRIEGPWIIAGDLNATADHAALRALLRDGVRDAAEQANSGWEPTWPSAAPLIAIDHVVVGGGAEAVRTRTDAVTGTDHLALTAWLTLPGE